MKKISLLLLCLCATIATLYAQFPLDSFYKTGTSWTTLSQTAYGFSRYSKDIYATFISGDSTIGSHTYKVLKNYKKGKYYYDHGKVTLTRYDSSDQWVVGGIRVDGEKVYFINLSADTNWVMSLPPMDEAILYDFDLKVGDTLAWKPYRNVIERIDSVRLSNNTYEKRYHFPNEKGVVDFWIRGLGSNIGFVNSYYEQPAAHTYSSHSASVCYNGSAEYIFYENAVADTANFSSCYLIFPLSVNNVVHDSELELYPNPVTANSFTITLSDAVSSVKVYDIRGVLISAKERVHRGANLMPAPEVAGVYIVQVLHKDGTVEYLKFQKL